MTSTPSPFHMGVFPQVGRSHLSRFSKKFRINICRVSFTLALHEIATLYPSGEIWEHWKVWPYLFSFSSMDASFSISSSFATSIISSMNLSVFKFGGSKGSALNIANACKIAPLTPLMWAWVIKAFSLAFYWDKRERATVITGKEQFIHGY